MSWENFHWATCQLVQTLSSTIIKRWLVLHWETWLSFQSSETQWPKLQPYVSIITLFSPIMFGGIASLRLTEGKIQSVTPPKAHVCLKSQHPLSSQCSKLLKVLLTWHCSYCYIWLNSVIQTAININDTIMQSILHLYLNATLKQNWQSLAIPST